ncbi:acetate kinase [Variovorax sp. J22R115]|uniref:acetate kinase n=1 Tax=Variovorax sp. J22R115 TaxID=3053509 RepID=UPI0025773415|nr:acetate kinase [Variovorax sp. J22R115]MDM0048581.1 acetate kinase [Variovorax sp. J22R115]
METNRPLKALVLLAYSSMAWTGAVAQSQGTTAARNTQTTAKRVEALQKQLADQGREIEALRKQASEQEARFRELQDRMVTQEARETLLAPGSKPQVITPGTPTRIPTETAQSAEDTSTTPVRVGVAPAAEVEAPPVAQIFSEPSILTPKGTFVLEPSLQYIYSSSNRVALVGYTVIPAILIGLVDVREFKNNTFISALTTRWGATNRMELELKVPYVNRSDNMISREIFTGSAFDNVFNTHGKGIGDVEAAIRYQIADGRDNNKPYVVGALRFKARNGKDPFEVPVDCVTRCVGNATGTALPLELPVGSGFYSLQPSLTFLLPSDPAVFFGGLSYTYNFARNDVSRTVLNGQTEFLGDVKPGDVFGMNLGMGLAINERSSFSLGMELYSVGRTKQNDQYVIGSVRTQLASLLLGYSYRYSDKTLLNVSVGAGLTRDTPDLQLTVRVPFTF